LKLTGSRRKNVLTRKNQPFPKIGIRPIIDGRRKGVRESLESQTMGMAKRTADFLSGNLKYPMVPRLSAWSPIPALAV
jgi:L-fucose isomerase